MLTLICFMTQVWNMGLQQVDCEKICVSPMGECGPAGDCAERCRVSSKIFPTSFYFSSDSWLISYKYAHVLIIHHKIFIYRFIFKQASLI